MPDSVLVIVHDLALGGTERIAIRLANAWAERGRRVTLFCGEVTGPLRALVGPGVTVVGADPVVRRAPTTRRALGRAAAAFLAREPHAIAFVPGNYHWPVIAALPERVTVVAQVSAALRKPQRGAVGQWLFDRRMRRLLATADALATLSDSHAEQARKIVRHERVATIALPALPDEPTSPTPAPDGPPLILGVGRLVPEKGFDLLIRAFARLQHTGARLAIVGDGPERAKLQALADRLGVANRVELAGYTPDPGSWMARASLFVLSSRHEGFPAVVVEAIGAGRRIVATDCTPAAALVRAAGGAVVPVDDVAALAAAMATMLATIPPDPAAIAAHAEPYRIGPVADAYLRLFAQVAA